jgi:ComF family protein
MFTSREGEDHLCGECLESPKKFRTARAFGVYDKALMTLIHCFKYNGKIQLACPLGKLLLSSFNLYWNLNSIDMIIPVPLHVKRFRTRGFNQAFLLVKDWDKIAATWNVKLPVMQIERHALVRNRWTEPQTGLGRKKRMANIKNAFSLKNSPKIIGKRILLVDDVLTTGATANECAKVLLRGGAGQVDVLTLARAV